MYIMLFRRVTDSSAVTHETLERAVADSIPANQRFFI